MDQSDFDGLADIHAAVEAAGGNVKELDVEEVQDDGMAAVMSQMMGGNKPSHHHFIMEVCVNGPTTCDIPDPDSALDPDDVMTAVAIAHGWAMDNDLDELAADLDNIGQRIGQQATGQAHPADEMSDFSTIEDNL